LKRIDALGGGFAKEVSLELPDRGRGFVSGYVFLQEL